MKEKVRFHFFINYVPEQLCGQYLSGILDNQKQELVFHQTDFLIDEPCLLEL